MYSRIIIIACILFASIVTYSQDKRIVQLSGLVVQGDSMYAIPGVHVFSPVSGRGVTTNLVGFFSIPVLTGDTLIIAAVGFKKRKYGVPLVVEDDELSIVISMQQDTLFLPEVSISGFPPERVFKQAFLAMNIPQTKEELYMEQNLNDQVMRRLLQSAGTEPSLSHSFYMQRQMDAMANRHAIRMVPFLDPFAWSRFFKDVKAEREKKEARERKQENDAGY